jgi:hypothetical protein
LPRVSHQNTVCTSRFPYTCYMPCPSRFDHPNIIWREVQTIELLTMLFSPLPRYLVPLRLEYCPQKLILINTQPALLPECERPSFTPIQTRGKICF